MAIETSVIPVSASNFDDETIDVNASNELRIKPEYENELVGAIAEHEVEIIELQAGATATPFDHDTLVSDTFSDADGYRNSVETGTTTATHDTNKYKRANTSFNPDFTGASSYAQGIRNGHVLTGGNSTQCNSQSFTIAGSGTYELTSVATALKRTNAGSGSTIRCSVFVASSDLPSGSVLGSAEILDTALTTSLARQTFTFATPLVLDRGTVYCFVITCTDTGSVIINQGINTSGGYSGGKAGNKAESGSFATIDSGNDDFDFVLVTNLTENTPVLIDVSLGTLASGITHTQLICRCPERETGDSVTYKLKNATESDSDLATDTKNALVNLTTVPTGIEINLIAKSGSPTTGYPSVRSYCLKIWRA